MFSIILVTYKPNKKILQRILKKIGYKINVIIISNSKNYDLNDLKFSNKTRIIRSKNNGNGAGINLGLKNCTTNYALYLDTDIKFNNNFFKEFNYYLKKIKDFSILVPNHGNIKTKKPFLEKYEGEASIMLFNLKKFKNHNLFDENYFLYFEEQDLFHRCKKKRQKAYFVRDLNIKHLRGLSTAHSNKISNLRSWHYMWSMFYYYKKNFSYVGAIKKTFLLILKDIFMILIYVLLFDKIQMKKRFYRLYGVSASIFGLTSYLRP